MDEPGRAMGSAPGDPPLLALGRVRALLGRDDPGPRPAPSPSPRRCSRGAIGHADLDGLIEAVRDTRERLGRLRSDDAALTLATAHSTKGLEFDHVWSSWAWSAAASRAPER